MQVDVDIIAGESIDIAFGPVVNELTGAPINLRQANTHIRWVAKRSKDDADAAAEWNLLFVPNVTEDQGIAVPAVGSNNNGTILVAASQTSDITEAINLEHELVLQEPSGKVSRLAWGRVRVGRPVLRVAP